MAPTGRARRLGYVGESPDRVERNGDAEAKGEVADPSGAEAADVAVEDQVDDGSVPSDADADAAAVAAAAEDHGDGSGDPADTDDGMREFEQDLADETGHRDKSVISHNRNDANVTKDRDHSELDPDAADTDTDVAAEDSGEELARVGAVTAAAEATPAPETPPDRATQSLRQTAEPGVVPAAQSAADLETPPDRATRSLRQTAEPGAVSAAPSAADLETPPDRATRSLRQTAGPGSAAAGGTSSARVGQGLREAAAPGSDVWTPPDRATRGLRQTAKPGAGRDDVPALPEWAAPGLWQAAEAGAGPGVAPPARGGGVPHPAGETSGETSRETPGETPGGVSAEPGSREEAGPESTAEALEILSTLSRRPMTPLRLGLKRVRLWGGLLVVLLAILAFVQVLRPLPAPALKLTAASGYTFSGSAPALAWPKAGQSAVEVDGLGSLGNSGPETPAPIASVTKVMTAQLVLKDHPLSIGQQGPTIVVDQQAVDDWTKGHADGESVMKVSKGEKLTEYQALQMLLIPSANNVARLLGRWDAGTDAAFVAKMQSEAAALGMTQTTYTDPSGLLDTTKSTADDQLKLAKVAIEIPVFRQIVSTTSFSPAESGPTANTNALLGQDGVIGIKTGSDSAALGCLMWAAKTEVGGTTQTVLGVTLGQPALSPTFGILDNVMLTSKKLLVSAEQVLQSKLLLKQGQVVGYVDDGEGGRTPVVASQDVQVAGWSGNTVPVSLAPLGGVLPHTGKAGQAVGYLVVGSGASAQRIPVTLESDLAEPSYGARLTRIG